MKTKPKHLPQREIPPFSTQTKILFSLLLFFFLGTSAYSQSKLSKEKIIEKTNVSQLVQLKETYRQKAAEKRVYALQVAAQRGLPITKIDENGNYMELMEINDFGAPMYYVTQSNLVFNLGAANTNRASSLWTGGSSGLNLNGEGMTIGEWDGGGVRLTHQEFGGRVTQNDAAIGTSFHATHVAGTIMAAGVSPNAKGMAHTANLLTHEWTDDEAEMATEAANGLLISNHSYGFNADFFDTWEFGYYGDQGREWDEIQYNAPFYQVVKSAGNNRGTHNLGKGGYDLVNYASASKNSMVVASTLVVPNYTQPSDVVMSSFTSWGPTDDGRIKPDIAAKGSGTFSTWNTSDTAYGTISGTSMSTPSVSGALGLLQQHYNNLNGNFMRAATLKGIALNSADEAGAADGPDYEMGWGLMNSLRAAEIISNEGTSSVIEELTLNDGGSYTTTLNSDGLSPIELTICWTDVPGTPGAAGVLDNPLLMLVNDLDVRISKDGTTWEPWILDPANPAAAATTGDNFRDNVEKIEIGSPDAGAYTVSVTHKGTITNGSQDFSLIVNGATTGVVVCTATVPSGLSISAIGQTSATASWSAVANVVSYDYQYREVGAASWTVVNTTSTSVNITGLTAITDYEVQVRSNCSDASSAYSASSNFTTLDVDPPCTVSVPTGLASSGVTSSGADISWDSQASATSYDYQYRATGAASWTIVNTASTSASISGLAADTEYEFQVRAICPDQTSAYSASSNFTTDEVGGASCDVAPALSASGITESSATISWPAIDGVTNHSYRYRLATGGSWTTGSTTASSVTISGLSADTEYEFRMRASCTTGNSPLGSINFTTTDGGTPTCDVPSGLASSSVGETTATISWGAVSIANTYDVRYRETGAASWIDLSVSGTSTALSGLTADTDYEFQVQSNCTGEVSGYSASSNFTTTDGGTGTSCDIAPQNLSASTTATTATITWSAVDGANSYTYKNRRTTGGGATNGTVTSNSVTLTGLIANATYTFSLRTSCDTGNSPAGSLTYTTGAARTNAVQTASNRNVQKTTLFPNPAKNVLNILRALGEVQVNIYNLNGALVKQSKLGTNEVTINLTELKSGIYMVNIVSDTQSEVKRFVKE